MLGSVECLSDRGSTGTSEGRGRGGSQLERVTVNLIPRAWRALELATELTGDTKTDTINRALQIYAYMEQVNARGGSVYVKEAPDFEIERLKVF